MTKPKRLTEDEIKALTDAEIQDATGYCGGSGQLAAARSKNEYYFLGLAKGDLAPPEITGRSSVVDTTVRNTVLGMEAPLIKTFCGTDNVVEFAATSEEDEPKAKQATDYLNHILRKKNPGYTIISTWIRDAILARVGFIKVWWDDSDIESTEEYRGQTDVQLAILLDDEEIEPTEQRAYPDPEAEKAKAKQLEQMGQQLFQMQNAAIQAAQGMDQQAAMQTAEQMVQAQQQMAAFEAQPVPMLYDITVKRKKTGGRLCIENVPPDEFLVSRRAKNLTEATFVGHRLRRTINELRASGYKNVESIASDDGDDLTGEAAERDWMGLNSLRSISVDEGSREVWITECYVKADFDGTGVAEWNKIVRAGNEILERTPVDEHPFVALPSIPLAHRFFGLCPADLAIEGQRIKTSLRRALLDNIYLQVNGRTFAVDGQVNLDDLLNNKPGGVVRIKNVGAVGALQQGMSDAAGAMALLEATELADEESTGWTRQTQGGNGLQLSQTATQANIVTNRADSRIEIISRTMAETGFTDLFKKMLRLVTQYQNKAERVKLGSEWADIDPREWTNQFDLTINVGIGTGNKDQQVQHLALLGQQQQFGLTVGTATPENVYNGQVKLTEALGFKNGDLFFTNPKNAPPQQPPPDPNVIKAQMDDARHQREMQAKQQQADLDRQAAMETKRMEAEYQMQVDQNRQQLEAEQQAMKIQLEADLAARAADMRHQEQLMKLELEREKLAMKKYELDLMADSKIVAAQIAAQQQSESLSAAAEQSNQDMNQ